MRVIDIQLDGMKQVLDLTSRRVAAIDEILRLPSQQNLSSNRNFGALFITNWGGRFVFVVEDNCNTGLCNSSLTLLVDKLRQISCSNLAQICNSQNEANRIKNIGFSGTIQTRNRVEMGIESAKQSIGEGESNGWIVNSSVPVSCR